MHEEAPFSHDEMMSSANRKSYAENMMNLSLLDRPRWGWTVAGGVSDLLTPHERARRQASKRLYLRKRKRERPEVAAPPRQDVVATPTDPSALETDDAPVRQHGADSSSSVGVSIESKPAAVGVVSISNKLDSGEKVNDSSKEVQDDNPSTNDISQAKMGRTGEDVSLKETSGVVGDALSDGPARANDSTREATTVSFEGIGNNNVVDTSALREDGSLDIFAYHRGKEGFEQRDWETGELLGDTQPTDSNHYFEEPKLNPTITIRIPLNDEDELKENSICERFVLEDTITWNLADPQAPTPMDYAADLALNYGLSFGQTMDIATSIQDQLNRVIADNCTFCVPVAVTDTPGVERPAHYQPTLSALYGQVIQTVPGGTSIVAKPPTRSMSARTPSTSRQTSRQAAVSSNRSRGRQSIGAREEVLVEGNVEELEDIYREEVLSRMMGLSIAENKARCLQDGVPVGLVEFKKDYHCHICHKKFSICGLFACRIASHSYCKRHLADRLGMDFDDSTMLEHCPICALLCKCSKCRRRLDGIALHLKQLGATQQTEPSKTVYEDMFHSNPKCQPSVGIIRVPAPSVKKTTSKSSLPASDSPAPSSLDGFSTKRSGRKTSSRPTEDSEPVKVTKVSVTEFPVEVRNGLDIDPGTVDDYQTVYTANGSFKRTELLQSTDLDPLPESNTEFGNVVEDGNTDSCHVCGKHGNLICCDYCPRAFHIGCFEREDVDANSKWQCHVCTREKEILPEDKVNGDASLPQICIAFRDVPEDLSVLSLLSMIHEMVVRLINYDFGYVFRDPVDVTQVEGYADMVKNPMDLGTIGEKLINGTYKSEFATNSSWDDVIVAVLKDIELVWHNCFIFNYEGSAVYRMAEVQRRRAMIIRRCSFGDRLSEDVKQRIEDFVKLCESERKELPTEQSTSNAVRPPGRTGSRHKITVRVSKTGTTRPVAILDPQSGTIAKIYSSLKSAAQAADFLSSKGCKCEVHNLLEHTVKGIINHSSKNPSLTLFGYRWLPLEDLRRDKVMFINSAGETVAVPTSQENVQSMVVEMIDGETTYTFMSIEDAVSSPKLPSDCPIPSLRKFLLELIPGNDHTSFHERKWRRILPYSELLAADQSEISLRRSWKTGDSKPKKQFDYIAPSTMIVREDLIARRRLATFDSHEEAHSDWLIACKASLAYSADEDTSMEYFRSHYIYGNRNMDGMIWRALSKSPGVEDSVEGGREVPTEVNEHEEPLQYNHNMADLDGTNGSLRAADSHELTTTKKTITEAIKLVCDKNDGSDMARPTPGERELSLQDEVAEDQRGSPSF